MCRKVGLKSRWIGIKMFGIELNLDRFERQLDFIRATQKYFYMGVLAVLAAALFLELISPTWGRIRAENKQISQYRNALAEKQAQVSNKKKVVVTLKDWEDKLADKENQFFSDSEFDEFTIYMLPEMAVKYGAKIQSVNYGTVKVDKQGISAAPITLEIAGNYRGIVNLVNDLEHFEKVIQVNQVQISRRSLDPFELRAQIQMELMMSKAK